MPDSLVSPLKNSVLYYPFIEISNIDWLKGSLLLWDKVYRIAPESYKAKDSEEVRKAIEKGLLENIKLENEDFDKLSRDFGNFINKLEASPAGLEYDEVAYLHPDKIDSRLYPLLEGFVISEDGKGFLEMPKSLVRGYMFFLANEVAKRRNLERSTDDEYSFSVASFFSEDGNFDEYIYDREAGLHYSSLIMKNVIPLDIGRISIEEIAKANERSIEEKKQFRRTLREFADNLSKIESSKFYKEAVSDFSEDLNRSLDSLKKSQGIVNKETLYSIFIAGAPIALTSFGAFSVGAADPFSPVRLASSIAIGAIASYSDIRRVKSATTNPYGLSYLLNFKAAYSSATHNVPKLDRYMEEFIND